MTPRVPRRIEVELPETETDSLGQPQWRAEACGPGARVFVRASDGLVAMDGVPTPLPDSLAVLQAGLALAAAYLHCLELDRQRAQLREQQTE